MLVLEEDQKSFRKTLDVLGIENLDVSRIQFTLKPNTIGLKEMVMTDLFHKNNAKFREKPTSYCNA